jgi:hypothetical protein
MSSHREKLVGLFMMLAMMGILSAIDGRAAIKLALFLSTLGIISVSLWSFKTKRLAFFCLVKIPLNLLFNVFLLGLLLKAWALRDYKKELERLEMRRRI